MQSPQAGSLRAGCGVARRRTSVRNAHSEWGRRAILKLMVRCAAAVEIDLVDVKLVLVQFGVVRRLVAMVLVRQ
jgi:hypothetical protein